jgi:ferric-dicitrate binding protein FerR (iron transport regulator)
MDSQTDAEQAESQLLDQLASEYRDAPSADIDFDVLENRIMARVEQDQSRGRRRTMFAGGLSLAAAAAVALFMSNSRTGTQPTEAPVIMAAPAERVLSGAEINGNGLSRTDRVVAADGPVHVVHAKHSEWTLTAGSEARALEVGSRVVVALSRGELAAKVVPQEKPETFVVEAKDTWVAVHGTDFSVVLEHDAIAVDVREGVVAVGPRGEKPRWFLNAGDKGSFDFAGKVGSVERDSTTASAQESPEAPATGNATAQRKVVLAPTPPAAELRALSDRAASVAIQCFAQHVNLEAGVRITAKSEMTVSLAPNGRLGSVSFEPPLAPQVQACVQSRLGAPKLTASQNGGKHHQTVWLSP